MLQPETPGLRGPSQRRLMQLQAALRTRRRLRGRPVAYTEQALPRLRSAADIQVPRVSELESGGLGPATTPRGRARERPGNATGRKVLVELGQALVMQPTSGSSQGWKPRTFSFTRTTGAPFLVVCNGNACNICENRRLKAVAIFANEGSVTSLCCHWRWLRFGHWTGHARDWRRHLSWRYLKPARCLSLVAFPTSVLADTPKQHCTRCAP